MRPVARISREYRSRPASIERRFVALSGAAILVATFACGDPYKVTNPYDPAFPVSVAVTGPDTVFSFSEVAQFGAVAVPAFPDSAFTIGVTDSISFPPAGRGAFLNAAPPLYPAVRLVTVIAGLGAIDTFVPRPDGLPGLAVRLTTFRHGATKVVALTQRVVRIQLRCPDTHACAAVAAGGTWSVWADGFDALNQQIVALHSSVANPATGTPVATYIVRDPTVASVAPVGIRAATVTALKTGTTWIVGTRGALLDSLALVVQ